MSDKDRFVWKMSDVTLVKKPKPWAPARRQNEEKRTTVLKGWKS